MTIYSSNKLYLQLTPKLKSDLETEFESCLTQLKNVLLNHELNSDSILKQTIFINASDRAEYHKKQNYLIKKLEKFYNSDLPATSFVAQPPADQQHCIIDFVLFKSDLSGFEVQRKKLDDIPYTVLQFSDTKEVYAGGLASECNSYNPLECSQNAFDMMERILEAENLTFANITRQWNYIEGILAEKTDENDISQNYQIFNDVRSNYYSKTNFDNGYPAATGIGMNTGGIIIEFIALKKTSDVDIFPINNPEQVNAYCYSDEVLVGKSIEEISQFTTPKFERAKFVSIDNDAQIFISGTAAILGQDSIGELDAKIQTKTTIDNINQLVEKSNLVNHKIVMNGQPIKLSHLRVYVKSENDLKDVKAVCEKFYPNVEAIYLISDICREDLVVELEGVFNYV